MPNRGLLALEFFMFWSRLEAHSSSVSEQRNKRCEVELKKSNKVSDIFIVWTAGYPKSVKVDESEMELWTSYL